MINNIENMISNIEKYYSVKSMITRRTWIEGKGTIESLVVTKNEGSFITKSMPITRKNLMLNCMIKDQSINVSLKKLVEKK